MKSYRWAPALLLLAACNNIETGLFIRHVAAPDDMCGFEAEGDESLGVITYDTANADTLMLVLRVVNNLTSGQIEFGEEPDLFVLPNAVTPVRFDLRWECDANGFSDDLGDLIVPQFSATEPFCLSEDTRDFVGFDVVPATGQTIQPGGEEGLVEIRPITAQLGRAFNDVFELAKKAQACCDSARGCDDQSLQAAPSGPGTPCGDLQSAFDNIAGPGRLSAQSFSDVQKFRPFLIYDHNAVTPRGGPGFSPSYQIVLRGVLEGVTQDGSTISSNEWRQTIHLCANCLGGTACTNL